MEVLTDEEFRLSKLKYCEYYKGEEECPKGVDRIAWNGERMFIQHINPKVITDSVTFFSNCMLVDITQQFDKPITLLASMFESYCHFGNFMFSPDEHAVLFRDWIKTIYKPKPSNK